MGLYPEKDRVDSASIPLETEGGMAMVPDADETPQQKELELYSQGVCDALEDEDGWEKRRLSLAHAVGLEDKPGEPRIISWVRLKVRQII